MSIWRSKTTTNHERRRHCKQNSKFGSSQSSVGFGLTSVFFLIIFSKLTFNCRLSLQSLLQLIQFLFWLVPKEFYALLIFFFAIFWFREGYIFFETMSLKKGDKLKTFFSIMQLLVQYFLRKFEFTLFSNSRYKVNTVNLYRTDNLNILFWCKKGIDATFILI